VADRGDILFVDTRDFPESFRLTFEFDESTVRLAETRRLEMTAPPSTGVPPAPGAIGAWVDLRDDEDQVRFVRRLHDPYGLVAEHHAPDGSHEVVVRPRGKGSFRAVVPAMPEPLRGQLWVSDRDEDGTLIPASESLLTFELPGDEGSAA
jgi:hypothetical protein